MPVPIKLLLVACAFWVVNLDWMSESPCVRSELIIIRKVNMRDLFHRDRFNIPRSKCTDIRQGNKCAVYGGFERSPNNPCKCLCPPLMGTMSFKGNRWKCIGNEDLRLREECGFYFPYESSKAFIKMVNSNRWQTIHGASSGCKLDAENSFFLSCNGSWITSPRLARNIDVISRGFDQVARGYAYQVRLRKNSFLSGKLIKVGLTCTPFGGNPCLLFKMRGRQNCFSLKRRLYKKLFRKNKKAAKALSSFSIAPSLSPQPSTLVDGIARRLSNMKEKPISNIVTKNKKKDESRAEQLRKDEDVTTIILIFSALVLGAIIVALTINLFFCSSDQETYKEKHIFLGRQNKRSLERKISQSRAPSNTSTQSLNITSSKKLHSLQDNCLHTTASRLQDISNTKEIDLFTENSPTTTSHTEPCEKRDNEPCTMGKNKLSLIHTGDDTVLINT